MNAAAHYGFCLGLIIPIFTRVTPQPAGTIVLYTFFAAHAGWCARTCWHRTGLLLTTVGMGFCAVSMALLAMLAARGNVFPDVPHGFWFINAAGLIVVFGLQIAEKRVNRLKVDQWREHLKNVRARDFVTANHIPWLR